MRIWHKDLIEVLPDNLLIELYQDCSQILDNIKDYNSTGDDLCDKIMMYEREHFYTYCIDYVLAEIVKRGSMWVDITEFQIKCLKYLFPTLDESYHDFYLKYNNGTSISHAELFEFWHSPRYLQQCVLFLEEMYDCDLITYTDWFKIMNHVKNSTTLCAETYECLFL